MRIDLKTLAILLVSFSLSILPAQIGGTEPGKSKSKKPIRLDPVFGEFVADDSVSDDAGIDLASNADAKSSADTEKIKKYSLSECIQLALSYSPDLESAAWDRSVAQGKLAEAKSAFFLPEAKLRVLSGPVPDVPDGSGPESGFPDVNTDLTDLGPFIRLRVEAVQPLFTFGKLTSLKKAAERGVSAKRQGENVARNEVIYRIKKVYFGLSYLHSLKGFLNDLKEKGIKAQDRVQDQLKKNSPDVTEIDLMRLKVFLAETEKSLIQLKSGIDLGLSTLAILMGKEQGSVNIKDQSIRFKDQGVESIDYYIAKARSFRPELKQLQDVVAIRKELLNAQKSDFFPMFFVGGFYEYSVAPGRQDVDNPFLKDDFNFSSGGAAFGLEQKLGFHLTNSRKNQAAAEYRKAVSDQKRALMGIEIEIRKAHSDAEAKKAAVKASEVGYKAGRSWVLATTLNFGVGLVPVKDLLEAFVAYSRVRVGFLDTIHDFEVALADLSKVVGTEVTKLKY